MKKRYKTGSNLVKKNVAQLHPAPVSDTTAVCLKRLFIIVILQR